MNKVVHGVIAGAVATLVLSALMVMKAKLGMMPNLNVIKMLASVMGGALVIGWLMHFMIGVGYGVIFSVANELLPGKTPIVKAIVLVSIGWFMMMLIVMPMMGAGLFGMKMGIMAPIMTLILHIIFGATLGLVYGKLDKRTAYAVHG